MQRRHYFSKLIKELTLNTRVFVLSILLCIPVSLCASTITLKVANGKGGAIVNDNTNTKCHSTCTVNLDAGSGMSLFALPDIGYRFVKWSTHCPEPSAPFCVLTGEKDQHLTAHFVKNSTANKSVKVLLLLHGEDHKASVWNEFAEKYFNHQCPTIYGGVILDDAYPSTENNVLCYRMAFGYYRLLQRGLAAKTKLRVENTKNIEDRQQINEIQATLLAILARHPNSKISLVAEQSVTRLAQAYLNSHAGRRFNLVGLLSLQSTPNQLPTKIPSAASKPIPTFYLTASPEQAEKINQTLVQFTELWWLAK